MRHWGEGYVTDVQYVDEFNPEQSPQNIALAATLRGFESPDLSGEFAYCELGCGKGLTSLILAAANPQAEFHAVDFNPSYIARAEAQARAAQLNNITFHERSIEELNGPDTPALPKFDVVALHGVWSWVSPDIQNAILEFLKRRVKPGGLVYITYNLLTQWAMFLPLQGILKELSASSPGGRDLAVRNAFATIERLTELKVIPANFPAALKRLKRGVPEDYVWPYLAHEFLPEHWMPTSHTDVARALGLAKLTFAGSADLLRNLTNVFVNETQWAGLAEIPAPELRETLADWASGHWLRFDVFVRGARRIPQPHQDALLGNLNLALVRLPPDFIELPGPNGAVRRAHRDKYARFIAALESRPHSVAELLALPAPPGHGAMSAAELVCVLVGTGLALPFHDAAPEARAACARLNRMVESEGEIAFWRHATMAVAPLRAGLVLASSDFDVYLALRQGERPNASALAERFFARSKAHGAHPTADGRPFANEAEAHEALTMDFAKKIDRLSPLWRKAGLIEAPR